MINKDTKCDSQVCFEKAYAILVSEYEKSIFKVIIDKLVIFGNDLFLQLKLLVTPYIEKCFKNLCEVGTKISNMAVAKISDTYKEHIYPSYHENIGKHINNMYISKIEPVYSKHVALDLV